MRKLVKLTFVMLALGGGLVSTAGAQTPGRTADAILADLKDLESKAPARPTPEQIKDKAFIEKWRTRDD